MAVAFRALVWTASERVFFRRLFLAPPTVMNPSEDEPEWAASWAWESENAPLSSDMAELYPAMSSSGGVGVGGLAYSGTLGGLRGLVEQQGLAGLSVKTVMPLALALAATNISRTFGNRSTNSRSARMASMFALMVAISWRRASIVVSGLGFYFPITPIVPEL